ncbi:MAG: glycosyltransferase [Aquificaceae bacterium]
MILTEASRTIGQGHLSRCLALKQALLELGVFSKLFVRGDNTVKAFAKGAAISEWLWWDKAYLKALSRRYSGIVIDSYHAPERFYWTCAEFFKPVVAIDDYKRLSGDGVWILNPGPYAFDMGYLGKGHMLGPSFALLRKPFWGGFLKKIRARSARFLITFGGEDIRGLTPRFVRALREAFDLELYVVLGHASRAQVPESESVKVYRAVNARTMRRLMEASDIAISAGGQTTFELARVGLAAVLISVADNQLLNCKSWHELGVFHWAGNWDQSDIEERVIGAVLELFAYEKRLRAYESGTKYVDGLGAMRVARKIIQIS